MPQIATRMAGRHAVARGGGVGFGAVLRQLVLAARDALRRHGDVEVVPDRARELGLRTVGIDHAWEELDAVEGQAKRLIADAGGARAGSEGRDPFGEGLLLRDEVERGLRRRRGHGGWGLGRRLCSGAAGQGRDRQRRAGQPSAA